MKHAVLGAGAIGGLMATAMSAIGEDITLVVRPEKLAGYPERLTLEQPSGTVTAAAHCVAKLAESVDVLWIATKTYQLAAALESVAAAPGLVVPLLNGVDHVAVLRKRFGHDRVVPGTIAVEAERLAEGRFAQRSTVRLNVAAAGETVLGELLQRLQERFGFVCHFFDNEAKLLWTKLCFLAPFALVTSASGKNKGEIFADVEWNAKLYGAIAEAANVARAEGAEIDISKTEAAFNGLPDAMRSSMAKDLLAGRQLELDAIAGPILRGGGKYRIEVPITRELVSSIASRASQAGLTTSLRAS